MGKRYWYGPLIRKSMDFGLIPKVMLADALKKTIDFHRRVDESFRLHYNGVKENQ